MPTTTTTKTYFDVIDGNLTFKNISVVEVDQVNGASVSASFISGSGAAVPVTVGSELGFGWSAFQMAVLWTAAARRRP